MKTNQAGFSLLEVLIAVAILTGMSLLLYTTMNRALTAKERVEKKSARTHEVRVVLNKMSEDLVQAVMANKVFAGVENSYTTGMKGSSEEIYFSTFGHFHYLKNARDTDQTTIGYYLKNNEDGFYDLMRRESGLLSEKIDEGGVAYPVLKNVKSLKLDYYDSNKKEWVSEWDSTQLSVLGRLPMAVKIEFVIIEPKENDPREIAKELSYSTMARIEMFNNEINF